MMSSKLWVKLAIGTAVLALAACSGGGGDGGGGTTPTPVQNQFGATFSNAFGTNANAPAGPIDPQPGDLPPVSLTTDPINF